MVGVGCQYRFYWFLMCDMKRLMYFCKFMGNVCIWLRNCGLDVKLMSRYTCRSRALGHWNAWYSSPIDVPWQNLQVHCSLGVWVCLPSSMSSLWLEHLQCKVHGLKYGGLY